MIFCVKVCNLFAKYDKIQHMKYFKKKTLALVLASVISVAGSFAAENYKNSIMAINFEQSSNGALSMVVETRTAYSGNVSPVKKDANTYVLMLPEVNNMASTPDLTKVGHIESVNIKTMPYSQDGKGYTRITIKTFNNVNLFGKNKVYIPTEKKEPAQIENKSNTNPIQPIKPETKDNVPENVVKQYNYEPIQNVKNERQNTVNNQNLNTNEPNSINTEKVSPQPQDSKKEDSVSNNVPVTENSNFETTMLMLGFILAVITIIYFFNKAKSKLTEVTGEHLEIEVEDKDDEEKEKKPIKKEKLSDAIKRIDSSYSKSAISALKELSTSEYSVNEQSQNQSVEIVDLDEVYQEKNKTIELPNITEEENKALEDFLSDYSFDEDTLELKEKELFGYSEADYEEIIHNENLRFSKSDIEKISKLLRSEISDETMKNLDKYVVSNPIIPVIPDDKAIAKLVADYAKEGNISFTQEDIDTIDKLMHVELEPDFVSDLKTDPKRTSEMEKEIINYKSVTRTGKELSPLKVKDMLPDLSLAIKSYGSGNIKSEYKQDTVYYSKDFDVSVLNVDNVLNDLAISENNTTDYEKPAYEIQLVDSNYTFEKIHIDDLPDLHDALYHPEKYEEPQKEAPKIDPDALLKSIDNVAFKPFYDGTTEFEVLNHFEDEENDAYIEIITKQNRPFLPEEEQDNDFSENDDNTRTTDVFDLNRFEEKQYTETPAENADVADELQEEIKVESDKEFPAEESSEAEKVSAFEETVEEVIEEKKEQDKTEFNESHSNIQEIKEEEQKTEQLQTENVQTEIEKKSEPLVSQPTRVNVVQNKPAVQKVQPAKQKVASKIGNNAYTVADSVSFTSDTGLKLIKSEKGLTLFGYSKKGISKIKEFDKVSNSKIMARLSETTQSGTKRYIVKVGINKFVLDFDGSKISFVMDLC